MLAYNVFVCARESSSLRIQGLDWTLTIPRITVWPGCPHTECSTPRSIQSAHGECKPRPRLRKYHRLTIIDHRPVLMGKHHLLRHLARRYKNVDPTSIPPIPRWQKDYKILLVHGGRVYMLRNSRGLRHHLLLHSCLWVLEPVADRQMHQQAGSLADPFGHQHCHRCHHLPHTSADGSQVEHECETKDRGHRRLLHRNHVSVYHPASPRVSDSLTSDQSMSHHRSKARQCNHRCKDLGCDT